MIWEGRGLRRLGRNLRPCFFPAQPFLVDGAVRESHECLASAPLYVFPAFVIELFLSTSGFFKHATWGFVCSSILKVGEVESSLVSLFLLVVTGQGVWACAAWPGQPPSREQMCIGPLSSILGNGAQWSTKPWKFGPYFVSPCPLPPCSSVINYKEPSTLFYIISKEKFFQRFWF